jgi:hypothetical protein
LSPNEKQTIASNSSNYQEKGRSLSSGHNLFHSLEYCSIYIVTRKVSRFKWVPGSEKILHQADSVVLAVKPLEWYESANPTVLEVSILEKDKVCIPWKAPIRRSQCRPF